MVPAAIREMLCSVFNVIRGSIAVRRMRLAREVGCIQNITTISFQ